MVISIEKFVAHNGKTKITFILRLQAIYYFYTMENLIFFLATSIVLRLSSSRKWKKYQIGDTGCTALLFSDHPKFVRSITSSGDYLYTYDFQDSQATYGVICIQMQQELRLEEAQKVLHSYINKLRGPFFILHQTGIEPATDWNSMETISMTNYWQDTEQRDWKVKGYTNGKVMAVLYVTDIAKIDVKKQECFLDSFFFESAL
jgi:hypothetical protein